MKSVCMLTLFVLLCAVNPEAQTFDIIGSYQGGSEGSTVRIIVEIEDYEEYQFLFMAREEVTPVLSAEISITGEYVLPINHDAIRLRFHEDRCLFFNEDKTYTFTKTSGAPGTIPGKYVSVPEEGVELVLLAETTGTGYDFTFEAWETENVFTAPMQENNTFSVETSWGDTITMEFFPDAVSFSSETMEPLVLKKE